MTKAKPRVSIGLPVFNAERYLAEALDSFLNQTFTDFELIISDNASTDQTQTICRDYMARDQRIRYFRNEKNQGSIYNHNRVLALAQGEYFMWAGYDDRRAPVCLERCVTVLDREPNVVLAYPKTTIINEHGRFVGYYQDHYNLRSPKAHERFRRTFQRTRDELLNCIYGLIRMSALKKSQGVGYYHAADVVLTAELSLHGQFYEIHEYLYYRRLHPRSASQAVTTEEQLIKFYDPNAKEKIVSPRWRRLLGFVTAIHHAPLTPYERILCYGEFARFYLSIDRWNGAMVDVAKLRAMVMRRFQPE